MARTVKFEFDPFKELDINLPRGADKESILEEVADFTLASVLESIGNSRSPVASYGKFPALNPEYKKRKVAEGGQPVPNLELSGDLIAAMEVFPKGNRIVIRVKGKEGDKADGHNNHSGESQLPLRRFIPAEGEMFNQTIMRGIKEIIRSHEE